MIEQTVLDYLTPLLDVAVYMEVPPDPPEAFVAIEKTGSSLRNHIYTSTLAIQSYGPTLLAAATLSEEVKGRMLYGALPDEITRVSLNGDYNFTDTETKRYRYQAVFDITHY